MNKPEALRLACELEACPTITYKTHAAELRRLHAENEQITKYADALNDRCVRDAERIGLLLESLKLALEDGCSTVYAHEYDDCGERGCCGVLSFKPHADDCWVTKGLAAIAAVGGEKT